MDQWIKLRVWFTTRQTYTCRYTPKRGMRRYPADQDWDRLFAREAEASERDKRDKSSKELAV